VSSEIAALMDKYDVQGCEDNFDDIINLVITNTGLTRTEAYKYVIKAMTFAEDLFDVKPEQNEIAAIVPFYNYTQSEYRRKNYFACVERLKQQGFPVFTAEAALEGAAFNIPEGPRIKRYVVRDPLFIKETLFNLTLRDLPSNYTSVAWLDADTLFERPDIVQATLDALKKYPVVQMFEHVHWVDKEGKIGKQPKGRSLVYRNKSKGVISASPGRCWPGLAWAARREIIEELGGLYDSYPSGSGDVFASVGFYYDRNVGYLNRYAPKLIKHFWETWGTRTGQIIKRRIGYVDCQARHMYHGSLKNRQYTRRHTTLKRANFDPIKHQERDENGIYYLTEACPTMAKKWMQAYMLELRRET
jgi:hypothetical protein